MFIRELAYHYRHPQAALPTLTYSFRDYVLTLKSYEKTPQFERARDYWRARIETLPPEIRLPLRTDPEAGNPHSCAVAIVYLVLSGSA